jgi:hypothetical protein
MFVLHEFVIELSTDSPITNSRKTNVKITCYNTDNSLANSRKTNVKSTCYNTNNPITVIELSVL